MIPPMMPSADDRAAQRRDRAACRCQRNRAPLALREKAREIVDRGKVGIRSQTRLAATGLPHPCRPRICRAGLRPAIMADNVAYGIASRPAD